MKAIQISISRQEAEELVDLLEDNRSVAPWRLDLADQLRWEFGMSYRDADTNEIVNQFKSLLEVVTTAAFEFGEKGAVKSDDFYSFSKARDRLIEFVANIKTTNQKETKCQ